MSRRTGLVVLLVLSLALAGLFAARAVMVARMWTEAPTAAMPIAPWMTPRYIVRAYGIPPRTMQALLGLDPGEGGRMTLEELAQARGEPVDALIARINAALPQPPESSSSPAGATTGTGSETDAATSSNTPRQGPSPSAADPAPGPPSTLRP